MKTKLLIPLDMACLPTIIRPTWANSAITMPTNGRATFFIPIFCACVRERDRDRDQRQSLQTPHFMSCSPPPLLSLSLCWLVGWLLAALTNQTKYCIIINRPTPSIINDWGIFFGIMRLREAFDNFFFFFLEP